MRITVVHPGDLGASDVERWRCLQRLNPALRNPFLSPEFTIAIGRARKRARVAVMEDGEQVVGFFPYELRGRLVGTAIGAGISDCQGLVHAPGLEWDAMDLVRACGLPVWEFDHLLSDQTPFVPYHAQRIGSPIMDVSSGYSSYVDERLRATKGVIRDIQRKLRKLEREVGAVRFEYENADPALLRQLMNWKSAQYRRTRVFDRFSADWIVQVVNDLHTARSSECTGTLSVLYAADTPVAAHFGIRSDAILSYWFPAYDEAFARYSAGLALLLRMAEAAAAHGADHVDLGRGQTRYKDELKSRELSISEGRIGASWPVTTARRASAAFLGGLHRVRRRRPLRHVRRLARSVRRHSSRFTGAR